MAKRQVLNSIPEAATKQSNCLIAIYGIEDAETIAKLTLEKIRANKKRVKK